MEAQQTEPKRASCPFIPVGDRVCILIDNSEEKTAGGLVIASKDAKTRRGTVVGLGPGKPQQNGSSWVTPPFQLRLGQRVILSEYRPETIHWDQREYLVASEDCVAAIVRE